VRKAFTARFANDDFWKKPLAEAESKMDSYVTPVNLNRRDEDTVAEIQGRMSEEREKLVAAVNAHAATLKKNAYVNQDRSLAAKNHNVVIITDPPGAAVSYVPVHEAVMQVARRNVKFPDELSYYNVTTASVDLGGSYVFRVKWPMSTKYFPGIRVTNSEPILLHRGGQ
jgi:hypothetical protein